MARELLILRHAKSAWDTGAPTDFERPLASRGHKDAPRVGRWIRAQGGQPDLVLSSPAARARETTLAVVGELGIGEDLVHWEPAIYAAGPRALLSVLAAAPLTANRVLLVGHNPGLEELLARLCGEELPTPEDGKLLPTAALAWLAMPDSWRDLPEGAARLKVLVRPRQLPG